MKSYFIKDGNGDWQPCLESDLVNGQLYRMESGGRSVETYWSAPLQPRNKVKITGLMKNGLEPIPLASRVIISKGQSLGVTTRFENADGVLLPLTDVFGLPIYELGGGVNKTIEASFFNGVAQLLVQFYESGEYVVTEDGLNLHLPEENKLSFESFYITVLD